MAEFKVHRGFLDTRPDGKEAGNDPAQPPRIEDDPLVELARIVSESAANLSRLGTQPGDEPTLILGRATPKPLPLRADASAPAGARAPAAPASPAPASSGPASSGPASSGPASSAPRAAGAAPSVSTPITFEDDLLAELRQSVDPTRAVPRPESRADARAEPRPAPVSRADVFRSDPSRVASFRSNPRPAAERPVTDRPAADEPNARVAQVVQNAMKSAVGTAGPAADDDGGPTIALNLRGGPRHGTAAGVPGAAVPPADAPAGAISGATSAAAAGANPLEDSFDDLFADVARRPGAGQTSEPVTGTATQPPRLGDNFPRPAVEPPTRGRPAKAAARKAAASSGGVGAGLVFAGSLLSVVVLGGLGFLGYRAYFAESVSGGGVPVIKAVGKVREDAPRTAQPAPADSTARLTPDRVEDQTKLVTKSEEPIDQVSVGPRRIVPGAPGTSVPQPPTAGDQPRTVKTVVVRPDGTVVQQTTPVAPATPVRSQPITTEDANGQQFIATAPQAMPVPVAPTAAAPKDPIGQRVAAATPAPPAAAPQLPPVAEPPSAASAKLPAAKPPATVPAPRLAPQAPAAAARSGPVGAPLALAPQPAAPAGQGPFAGQTQPRLASAPPPVPAAPIAPAAASGGGDFVVQISSQRSEADAQRALSQAKTRFSALAGRASDVQRADISGRGTYYRARFAGGSQEEAQALCSQLKSAGGDCIVVRR
jgi:hypothetical protein